MEYPSPNVGMPSSEDTFSSTCVSLMWTSICFSQSHLAQGHRGTNWLAPNMYSAPNRGRGATVHAGVLCQGWPASGVWGGRWDPCAPLGAKAGCAGVYEPERLPLNQRHGEFALKFKSWSFKC